MLVESKKTKPNKANFPLLNSLKEREKEKNHPRRLLHWPDESNDTGRIIC
jgi:hypothetical protein